MQIAVIGSGSLGKSGSSGGTVRRSWGHCGATLRPSIRWSLIVRGPVVGASLPIIPVPVSPCRLFVGLPPSFVIVGRRSPSFSKGMSFVFVIVRKS